MLRATFSNVVRHPALLRAPVFGSHANLSYRCLV